MGSMPCSGWHTFQLPDFLLHGVDLTVEGFQLGDNVNGDLFCDDKSQKNHISCMCFKENVYLCTKSQVENVCRMHKTRQENVYLCISARLKTDSNRG